MLIIILKNYNPTSSWKKAQDNYKIKWLGYK